VLDGHDSNRDLSRALEAARRIRRPKSDVLCCGAMGRIDLLVSASRALGRPELRDDARTIAAESMRSATGCGSYELDLPVELAPGLFQGIAGIGYELLRMVDPDAIPSVLQLQIHPPASAVRTAVDRPDRRS
jgi:lantibiotic modifying enzyme